MGKIRIALAYTVSNRFIPNMIKGFYENEDNRAIQFEFSEKQAAKIIDAFANRTLDLGFGARMDSDQLEYFHIFDEEIVAVVSSRHPLALRGSVKLQDLIREPMVSYTYNCGTRYWIDAVSYTHLLMARPKSRWSMTERTAPCGWTRWWSPPSTGRRRPWTRSGRI